MENYTSQRNPLFIKSERFIHSAELLAVEEDFDSAASRIYYAMYYIAQALLESLGLEFSSHRATISAYGQYFAKSEKLHPRFHKALINAYSQRQMGDYTIESGLCLEDIQALLTEARDFLSAAEEWLECNV